MTLGSSFACEARIVDSSSGGHGERAGGEDGVELIEFAPCDTVSCVRCEFTTAVRG